MNKEDYNKFYIQGSDHYLIPKDVFNELFEDYEFFKNDCKKYKEVFEKIKKHIENVVFYESPNEFVKVLIEILLDNEVE